MSGITVLSPLGINRVGSQPLAPRLSSLDGVKLGLLNNSKPNSLELQRRVVELLAKQHPVAGAVTMQKPSAAIGAEGLDAYVLGRLDEARRLGDRAVEILAGHHGFAAHALHLLGDVATHPDRFDAESGEAHYRQALALAEPRGMRPLIAHCHLGLGRLYRRTGKPEQLHEHLTTATTMCREMDMQFWLEQAERSWES